VEKLKFEKINIIIVGKVDKKKFINKNCNFIFHEYIKNIEDMSKIFSSADVFIFTSRIDNFPNVALEAQSCGLPIICFSSGGVTEINKNNYTGFVIKSFSVKNFVTKINSLISNDYLLKKFSQNSRRNALKNYSYKVISKKYNKILHDIS
jgi:glycosyltransferase involved in cell wall biosynthesis